MKALSRALLVSAVLICAMALLPSSASAALTVSNETAGGACSTVSLSGTNVTGGCKIHIASEPGGGIFKKHVFGIESNITTCSWEITLRIGGLLGSIAGWLLEKILGGAGCNRQACKDGSGEAVPWPVTATEGAALEGNAYLTTNLCIEPVGGGTDETCEIDIPFNETTDHRYELGHSNEMPSHGVSGFRCELQIHLYIEVGGTHDGSNEVDVEINHA